MVAPSGSGIVAVNGSPSEPSRSRALAVRALDLLGAEGPIVDLARLDPSALLALGSDPGVDEVRELLSGARVIVLATPIYRAAYTALTKSIFDLLPQGALVGSVTIPIATGYAADHRLAIDHGIRPLIASLGGWTTPTGVYATAADVTSETVRTALASAVHEASTIATVLGTSR